MKIHRKRQPTAVWLSALFVVSTLCSAEQDSNGQGISIQPIYYRQPMGIYARYTAGCGSDECIKNEAYALVSVYGIAGIDAALGWKNLNPAEDTYVWTDPSAVNELQDIFDGVDEWNRENPTATPKTVQLDINAGFNAPQWVFNKLASCDPMFGYWTPGTLFTNPVYYQYSSPEPSLVPKDCGKATFLESESHDDPQLLPLPLPWNPTYKKYWAKFIHALALQYGNNPDLVSVSIDGPTSSSAEMILPNESNDPNDFYKWNPLMGLTLPLSYQNTDQIFIEEWEKAIDLFSREFSGMTLALSTGNGLPNFPNPDFPNTEAIVPVKFQPVCQDASITTEHPNGDLMDCVAESTIVDYLADASHGGNNVKSVQEDGMAAGGVYHSPLGGGNLGSYGIRWWALISQSGSAVLPDSGGKPISRMMGGFQSGGIIAANATDIEEQGCNVPLADCGIIGPEQAFYNFLASYFDGTSVGSLRGPGHYGEYDGVTYAPNGAVSGNVPLNYLQIYADDATYYSLSQLSCVIHPSNFPDDYVITGNGDAIYMQGPVQLGEAAQQLQQIADAPLVEFPF
jgi:hypothetical protein